MFEIWAILGLIFGAAILLGILWFILYILATIIFEDLLGAIFKKIQLKKEEKDHYIY